MGGAGGEGGVAGGGWRMRGGVGRRELRLFILCSLPDVAV